MIKPSLESTHGVSEQQYTEWAGNIALCCNTLTEISNVIGDDALSHQIGQSWGSVFDLLTELQGECESRCLGTNND